MKTLRWKPLKSSVKTARAITGLLELISNVILAIFVLTGVVTFFGGAYGLVAGFFVILAGVVLYLILKMGYIALELLTEIADDTRLQLLAAAGEEYDQMVSSSKSIQPEVEGLLVEDDEINEIYNAAVKAYIRDGGRELCSPANSDVYEKKVVLRDSNGDEIKVMNFYDGQWIKP
jgi:hypothetical protein